MMTTRKVEDKMLKAFQNELNIFGSARVKDQLNRHWWDKIYSKEEEERIRKALLGEPIMKKYLKPQQ